jgi:hypothetical protein
MKIAAEITKSLSDLLSQVPPPTRRAAAGGQPGESDSATEAAEKARSIARAAALRAAGISGTLALPPGPLGLATMVPDLISIWKLQQAMVADIAAVYGKTAVLTREAMLYCLFRHGGAALTRDLVTRAGQRILLRKVSASAVQDILRKVGVKVSQRVVGKSLSRLVPVIGALGVGAYAYYDTTQVAATAIELFSKKIEVDEPANL